ncbi:hypothetical protein GALMADRAFT_213553 [Galerina marginata CBS 339.88]|uniref:Uncharacterized protein n=1 Tax=Galerina marginata (strain CBS 339.88) TaxID=685588 RepID=A0A067SPZ7_GALM3|nr:hypothetical protein GALMADRAFT_213553 [Galerina marginata CBS 339.88]
MAVDLCIRVDSVPRTSRFLGKDGFVFMKRPNDPKSFEEAVCLRLAKTIDRKLKSSGDRNSSQSDRSSWIFEFSRIDTDLFCDLRRWLRIHVVRCEPYQHILSLHSSGLMNFMTWKQAVSLFPRSTFALRRSFVSRQEFLQSDQLLSSHKRWLERYAKKEGIKIIGITDKLFPKVEVGSRFIGDKFSWVMEVQPVESLLYMLHYPSPSPFRPKDVISRDFAGQLMVHLLKFWIGAQELRRTTHICEQGSHGYGVRGP